MPRSARKESGYGIYHVMMRGTRGPRNLEPCCWNARMVYGSRWLQKIFWRSDESVFERRLAVLQLFVLAEVVNLMFRVEGL